MRRLLIAASAVAAWIALSTPASAATNQCTNPATIKVTADISSSTTWTAANQYILTKPIYVTSGATLTIEPGTVVRGEPAAGAGTNDPGTLVIARDSKIVANGTASNPIVFTDCFDDNVGASAGTSPYDTWDNALGLTGQWGGVVLLGRTYVSNNTAGGPLAAREVQIEGLTAAGNLGFYGNGGDDDDDSGRLSYANIRYGGFNLSANNEINGLTLGAIGRATEVHHVEVLQNKDDCYEFFGGTVGVKNLVCANGGDDGIDYDEGFRGKGQFIFLLQGLPGTDKSDKGGEHDGGNTPDQSQPLAIPTFYNVTYVGHGGNGGVDTDGSTVIDPVKAYTDKAKNTNLHFRDNAAGRYYNSFFADFGGSMMLIEGDPGSANTSGARARTAYSAVYDGHCSISGAPCSGDGDCPGTQICLGFYRGPDSQYELELQNDSFWCFGNANNVPDNQTDAVAAGGDALDHFNNGAFRICSNTSAPCNSNADCGAGTCITNAALGNAYFACSTALPIRTLARFDLGAGIPDQIGSIDPRPDLTPSGGQADLAGATTRPTPADGFFAPAAYRGAFASDNWADGWTTMSRLGYFPRCNGGANPLATPNQAHNLRWPTIDKTTFAWDSPLGAVGDEFYDVLRSSDPSDFSTADCIETDDDVDLLASDTDEPVPGGTFYYLVRPENDCGAGPIHFSSAGVEVTTASGCP